MGGPSEKGTYFLYLIIIVVVSAAKTYGGELHLSREAFLLVYTRCFLF